MSRYVYETKLCRITKVGSGVVFFVKAEFLESAKSETPEIKPVLRPMKRADILLRIRRLSAKQSAYAP